MKVKVIHEINFLALDALYELLDSKKYPDEKAKLYMQAYEELKANQNLNLVQIENNKDAEPITQNKTISQDTPIEEKPKEPNFIEKTIEKTTKKFNDIFGSDDVCSKPNIETKPKSPLNEEELAILNKLEDLAKLINEKDRDFLATFFSFDEKLKMLVQCGQFQRILSTWEFFGKKIEEGRGDGREEEILQLFLELYNYAAGSASMAKAYTPEVGSKYDFEQQKRVASDGTSVTQVLLSGLINPVGKLKVKALVKVK